MKKILVTLVAVVMVFAMAFPAFADVAVKSIEGKGTEPVSESTLKDDQGKEITDYEVKATGIDQKSDAPAEVQTALSTALTQVQTATKITDLAADAADKVAAFKDVKVEDMEVSQIFDLSIYTTQGAYATQAASGVATLSVKIPTTLTTNDPFVVLFKPVSGSWKTVAATIENGNIVLSLTEPGVVALATEATTGGSGDSPQTGDSTGIIATVFVCAALVACVGGCLIVDKKRA